MTTVSGKPESRKKFGTFPRGFATETVFPWPLVPAGELIELRYGKSLTEENRRSGDIPVFGTNGRCGWHDEGLAGGPGVILGRKGMGPLGVEWSDSDFWVIDTAYFALPKRNDLDLRYFYYLAKYVGLNHLKDGTSNPSLSRESFYLQLFPFPPLPEQQEMARILTDIDNKIDLNVRTNQTLEAMARAIFKSWFVDFDPIREEHPLFSTSLHNSLLGLIPAGWRTGSFLDIVEVAGGGTPKTSVAEFWGGDIPWFSVADSPREGDVFVVNTAKSITLKGLESSAARILPFGTTILTARGTVGKLALVGTPMAMNQSCYGLIGQEGFGNFFTYFLTLGIVSLLRQRTHGSVFDTITRDTLARAQVVIPPKEVAGEFDRIVAPFLTRILINLKGSATLAALRDTLLPKLLSGEIRVKQAEKIVGEAT